MERVVSNGLTPIRTVSGAGTAQTVGPGIASPMMDAPFSPGLGTTGGSAKGETMRIKIGQTSLHNPGGIHSWVGL